MKNIFTIKAFKCPNGLPPEECRHVQQIIINVANYYKKKKQQQNELEQVRAQSKPQTTKVQPIESQQRQRTRG